MLRKFILLLSLLLPLSPALAQYARYDGFIQSNRGPLANQFVAVCSQPAVTTTQPCSPLLSLYSTSSGTTLSNPLQSDAYGNFHFYVSAGTYTVQIYGPQVYTPYVLLDQTIGNNAASNGIYVISTAASAINAADLGCGSIACQIFVNLPGSYCDTTVLLSNLHTLTFGPGTYQVNIAGADSSTTNVSWGVGGSGANQTIVQGCPSVSKPVLTSQNFSTFTGGTNFYGVYSPVIQNLTIDCNSIATYGIQLYSRSPQLGGVIRTMNCADDGQWWEWGGTENDTGAGTNVNGNSVILESDYNTGNGFSFRGVSPGSINAISNLIAHNNGGWGEQQFYSLSIGQINSYENTSGGCDMKSGALIATNAECGGTSGWGLLQESGAGSIFISSAQFSTTSGIPFESRANAGSNIHGYFSTTSTGPCIKISSSGSLMITGTATGCTNPAINFSTELTTSFISLKFVGTPTALTSGSPSAGDYLNLVADGGVEYFQLPTKTINAGGWSPVLPSSNGILLSNANTDTHWQFLQTAGCSTGGAVGNSCATPVTVTWTTSFADANYDTVCTGYGLASGVPSGPYVVSQTAAAATVNYFAITAAAAKYSTITCFAIHP